MLIPSTISWKDTLSSEDQTIFFSAMRAAHLRTLRIVAQDHRTLLCFESGIEQHIHDAWARFHQELSKPLAATHSDEEAFAEHRIMDRRTPWRKLVFAGWNCFNKRLDSLLCGTSTFETIKVLHVEHLTPGRFDLSCVLNELPAMEELVLEAFISTPYKEGRNALVVWTEREERLQQDPTSTRSFLKLRTLALRQIMVDQTTLKTILAAIPALASLELRHIVVLQGRATAGATTATLSSLDRAALLSHVGEHCPRLVHFHLSTPDTILQVQDIGYISASFQRLESIELSSDGVHPQLLSLPLFTDRLTTLELEARYFHTNHHQDWLQAYLCRAPLLLHLRAQKVPLSTTNFVLKPRTALQTDALGVEDAVNEWSSQFDKPVWACRNLRTLHLQIDSSSHASLDEMDDITEHRVLFGYLSRVCPRLEEVSLLRQRFKPLIQTGLCLLSRLKRLRRFKVMYMCDWRLEMQPTLAVESDLEWMALGMVDMRGVLPGQRSQLDRAIVNSKAPRQSRGEKAARWILRRTAADTSEHEGPGIMGVSKVERERRVQATVDQLHRIFRVNFELSISEELQEMKKYALALRSQDARKVEEERGDLDYNKVDYCQALNNQAQDNLQSLDLRVMTQLSKVENVLKELQRLVCMSASTARDVNWCCTWPQLESFEVYQILDGPTEKSTRRYEDLLDKIRPDL
ncbi:hypothetical protein BGZ68_006996 [Mortierella alpina]|nr:hypothetical protein BGZ68_006996 [Mortierella alpina]